MTNDLSDSSDPEDELFEHYRFVVDRGQSPMRLDHYLKHHVSNVSRNRIQNGIDAEAIRVNDRAVKASYRIKPADVITLALPNPPRNPDIIAENIALDIIYEDDELLIVNKPAGMVVHPAVGHWSGTLVNALVYHLQNLPTHRNGDIRPGLVHRIDKDTSGLLVVAKTDFAMTFLAKQFYDHTIERTYYALVWGDLKENAGTITGYVGRNVRDRKLMDVFDDPEKGKHAVTHYTVLERFRYVNLIKCNLETGRTHQIRVHFKHQKHPLFGDADYGGDKILKGNTSGTYKSFAQNALDLLPRQALHAKSLGFVHPKTRLWVQFESELPTDFVECLQKWRAFASE